MLRLCLKIAIGFTLGFGLLTGWIRGHSSEDTPAHAMFTAAECAPPCFLGIIPGQTPTNAAFQRLYNHPWVRQLNQYIWYTAPGTSLYTWTWSGKQPAWIDDNQNGMFVTRGDVVERIDVATHIPMGDVWLLFQSPESGVIGAASGYEKADYAAVFDGLVARAQPACPVSTWTFWIAETRMTWRANYVFDSLDDYFDLRQWMRAARC